MLIINVNDVKEIENYNEYMFRILPIEEIQTASLIILEDGEHFQMVKDRLSVHKSGLQYINNLPNIIRPHLHIQNKWRKEMLQELRSLKNIVNDYKENVDKTLSDIRKIGNKGNFWD